MEIWSSLDTQLYMGICNIQAGIFSISVPRALVSPFVSRLLALALSSAPCRPVPLWQSVKRGGVLFTPCPAGISGSRWGAGVCRTSWRTAAFPGWTGPAPPGAEGSPPPPPWSRPAIRPPRWWSPPPPGLSSAPRSRSPSSRWAPTWGSRTPPSCIDCWTSSICSLCRSRCRLRKQERVRFKKKTTQLLAKMTTTGLVLSR